MGIEPTSSVWKTDALAVVLYPHLWWRLDLNQQNLFPNKSVYTNIEVTLNLHYYIYHIKNNDESVKQ